MDRETVITTVNLDKEDLEIFREMVGERKVSARIRELVRREVEQFTREEVKAQSLAGLTES